MSEQAAALLSEFDQRLRLIDEAKFVATPSITEILGKTADAKEIQSRDALQSAEGQVLDLPPSASLESVATALRNLLAVAYDEILGAASSPTTEEFDRILATLRKVSAAITSRKLDAESSAFYSGQLNGIAEFCEVCRRQKVPFRTAEVLVRRREAQAVLELLHSAGSLTLTAIAKSLHKASQNLQATVKDMTASGLIRRDQIGQAALYSSTSLGRLALGWSQKQILATPRAQSTTQRAAKTGSSKSRESGTQSGTQDEGLIRLAQSGDRAAFETLVRHYDQAVLRLAMHLTGSEEDARDIYQEAFLRVYRNLNRFTFECSFYTWVYRIVTNLTLDHLRRRQARASVESEEDAKYVESDEATDGRSSSNTDPERDLMQRELGVRIARALTRLTPREREVFELRHYQGLKLHSISESLNTSEETAKNTLFRATAKLRAALADAP
jgi:RNA polymerase sigma-70 factor, ECF subfamily